MLPENYPKVSDYVETIYWLHQASKTKYQKPAAEHQGCKIAQIEMEMEAPLSR